jgi:membrane associated rhomboid family serine protease
MIPLHDDNPTRTFPFVSVFFIVVNIAIFIFEVSLPNPQAVEAFFASYALVPAELTQSPSLPVIGTIFSSMFLHGGWLHLIGNMLYLWVFGNNIEDSVGHIRFIIFYLVCGVGAAGTQVFIHPDSTIPMVGASGAVSGVLGAYLLIYPRARVLVLVPIWIFLKFVRVPAWIVLLLWFGLQLLSGAVSLGQVASGGVAFWAHIGGFVAGMLLIPVFKKSRVRLFQ